MRSLSKIVSVTVMGLAALALAACSGGSSGGGVDGDMALGAPDGAKVTVIEYASPTCPHCALWQEETWPGFKERYVDTNKVRYIFRELPTPPADIATAGVLMARCVGEDRYFDVMHELMANQKEWATGAIQPRASLIRTANSFGMNEQQFTDCVTDPDNIAALEKRLNLAVADGVSGTPTFIVNGTKIVTPGSQSGTSLADLSTAIDAELAK